MNGSRPCDLIKRLSTALVARLNKPSATTATTSSNLNTIRAVSRLEYSSCYYYSNNNSWNRQSQIILAGSSYKPNSRCSTVFRHYSNDRNKAKSSLGEENKLTVKGSQRLMRQIYSRVHPDLFSNHLEAQVCVLLLISTCCPGLIFWYIMNSI